MKNCLLQSNRFPYRITFSSLLTYPGQESWLPDSARSIKCSSVLTAHTKPLAFTFSQFYSKQFRLGLLDSAYAGQVLVTSEAAVIWHADWDRTGRMGRPTLSCRCEAIQTGLGCCVEGRIPHKKKAHFGVQGASKSPCLIHLMNHCPEHVRWLSPIHLRSGNRTDTGDQSFTVITVTVYHISY